MHFQPFFSCLQKRVDPFLDLTVAKVVLPGYIDNRSRLAKNLQNDFCFSLRCPSLLFSYLSSPRSFSMV